MLSLFADIQLIDGYLKSTLLDLTRGDFHFIPNDLAKIIKKHNKKIDINGLKKLYYDECPEQFDEYHTFLTDHQLIFDIQESQIEYFEPLNLNFEYPFELQNIVVSLSNKNIDTIIQLIEIGLFSLTKNVGFIVLEGVGYASFKKLLERLYLNSIVSVEIRISSNWKEHEDELFTIGNGLVRIQYDDVPKNKYPNLSGNMILFTESQEHHTYFNRKLYIGENGEIRNSEFGDIEFKEAKNINSLLDIKAIIKKPSFQKYWMVNKGACDVCKDCELRHMCVDNRIPIQREDGGWYHEKECDYNPYIAKWVGTEGYHTLAQCGVRVNEHGCSLDENVIARLNEILWSD